MCTLFLAGCTATYAAPGTCPEGLLGAWSAEIPAEALFRVSLTLEDDGAGGYSAKLETARDTIDADVWRANGRLRFQSTARGLSFEGLESAGTIVGFVDYASNLYRVTLTPSTPGAWMTEWSPLPDVGPTIDLDLYIQADDAGGTGGFFFFRDDRLPGLFGTGVECRAGHVTAGEKNLGLTFEGSPDPRAGTLELTVSGPGGSYPVVFRPMSAGRLARPPGDSDLPAIAGNSAPYTGAAPADAGDGWPVAAPADAGVDADTLSALVEAIGGGEFPRTHAILLAKSGRLAFEQYFYGFARDLLHDMRSASKSLASALVGLAIEHGDIADVDSPVLPYFPEYRTYGAWDAAKAGITVRHLLTMSSGLDANDADPHSAAAEGRYQSQSAQPDWVKLALDAPMVSAPGSRLVYGGANPLILGGILDNVVGDRVEWFAEYALFGPLGIADYRIFLDPTGVPYMGGGMDLRPRDMLKIGQMYLDGGRWAGRQVLPESWVVDSFASYGRLEPLDRNGNEYGYLWWHEQYPLDGASVATLEARGNGGQYIFVVPELDAVAVVTSGNYRGGLAMTRQPQRIFERFLLPALAGMP